MGSSFNFLIDNIHHQSNEHLYILKRVILSLLLFLVFFNTAYSNSHFSDNLITISNGAIALAYPIANIHIDGDISDWPENLTRYPINKSPYGNEPKNNTDFDAYFQIGYNQTEQALYIIAIVTDDSNIIDTTDKSDWNTQDTFNFYIDEQHSPNGSGVYLYQFSQNYKDTNDQSISWDPTKKEANWDNIEIITKRKGTTTIYECKIKLDNPIHPGKSIGIDHVFIDKDIEDKEDTSSFIAWGNSGGKSSRPGRLGDVILMKAKEKTGYCKWEVSLERPLYQRIS